VPSSAIPTILGVLATLFVAGGAAVFFAYQQCANRFGATAASRVARSIRTLTLLGLLALLPIDAVRRWEPDDPAASVATSNYPVIVITVGIVLWALLLAFLLRQLRPKAVARIVTRSLRRRRLDLYADHTAWVKGDPDTFGDDLECLNWHPPVHVLITPPWDRDDGEVATPSAVRRSWGDRLSDWRERRFLPSLRKLRLRGRRLLGRLRTEDPISGLAETAQIALERGDRGLWDDCFIAARRRFLRMDVLSDRGVGFVLDTLRVLEDRARTTPLVSRISEIARTLGVLAERAPVPVGEEEPVALALADVGARSRSNPDIAVLSADLLQRLGGREEGLRAATRSLAALGERVCEWPPQGLRIIGEEHEPFLAVVSALEELWDEASRTGNPIAASEIQTALGIITPHLPAQVSRPGLEVFLYVYGRVGVEAAAKGWRIYAYAVANDLAGVLRRVDQTMRLHDARAYLTEQVAEDLLNIGALSDARPSANERSMLGAADPAARIIEILADVDADLLHKPAHEVMIKTHNASDRAAAEGVIGRLQERKGSLLGFTVKLGER